MIIIGDLLTLNIAEFLGIKSQKFLFQKLAVSLPYFGSNIKKDGYLEVKGKDYSVFDFKSQNFFKRYKYYYPINYNFDSIDYSELESIIKDSNEKILISIQWDFIPRIKVKSCGCYFYYREVETKEKDKIVLYNNFGKKLLKMVRNNVKTEVFIEPFQGSKKVLRIVEYRIEKLPKVFDKKNIVINTKLFNVEKFLKEASNG